MRRLLKYMALVLILFAVSQKQAKGQEYPWSLQYVTYMQTINPAYVGIWDKAALMLATKANWIGIGGAPISQYINYSTPIREQRSGVGITLQNLNVGREKRLFLTGDYSYRVRLDFKNYLQMGLRAGIVNYDNNLKNYQPYPDYIPDPYATTDFSFRNMTVFGIGAVFFSEDYYISLSAPQVIRNTFNADMSNFASTQKFTTVFLSGGYVFGQEGRVRFRPNLMIGATFGKSPYFDVSGIVYLPKALQVGINIRSTGSVCFLSQYVVGDRLKIGYALDYSVTSDIRKFQLGTHEILVGYDFNIYKRKYTKPTYF